MRLLLIPILLLTTAIQAEADSLQALVLRPIGQIETSGAAEIVDYDPETRSLFMIDGSSGGLQILSLTEPWKPSVVASIDLSPYGSGGNSVAVQDGLVAVAVQGASKQAPGSVVFFDTSGNFLSRVSVGALPDMVAFTPDGRTVLVANEGEPTDYCSTGLAADPEGSISVIDLSNGARNLSQAQVRTAGFGDFGSAVPAGVRIFGPEASTAQDLEPEYIAVSPDSTTAWVSLQENNALAVLDVATATVIDLLPLGAKDHSLAHNALDASNRDDTIRIVPWPVKGLYQPDAIAAYAAGGGTYLISANEGDARDYDCYSEEARVKDLELDPTAFPNAAALQDDANLGRLKTTLSMGDTDGDGDFDEIYSYGARSFTIWSTRGEVVFDSGSDLELITANSVPGHFNSNGPGTDSLDGRSDDKGPEPEGLAVGAFRGRTYAFVGLERTGGVAVYDVTQPHQAFFVTYVDNVNDDGRPRVGNIVDSAPEGLVFIPKKDAPRNRALLVVAHEESHTVTVYSVRPGAQK